MENQTKDLSVCLSACPKWTLRILFSFFWGALKSHISEPLGNPSWDLFLAFPNQSKGESLAKTYQN